MFNKQGFGSTPSTSAFGGFGTNTTAAGVTPFGQNSFNKPATGATAFQSTGFGNTGGSSLFGGTTATPSTGLFGATSTPAFGQQQQQQTTAFSGFNSGGSAPLFGSTATSGFAQPKPAFGGFGTTPQSTGLFGAQATAAPATSGASIFSGQSSSLFGGNTGFGNTVANNNVVGTPIKFNPLAGTDTMVKNNQTTTISTRHQCITCMKEYENKSLEELRLEDLQAGRKGPQQGGGMFGATTVQAAQPSMFGSPNMGQQTATGFGENKSLFGGTSTANTGLGGFGATTSAFGANASNAGLFGKPTGFGAQVPASTAATSFSFGNNNNNNANLFGGTAAQKPFGGGGVFGAQQPTSLFGATPTTNTGFGGFGAQQQPQQAQLSLFGQNKPTTSPFGMAAPQPAAQPGFGFNQTPAPNTQSGGLFGNKNPLGTSLNNFGNAASPFGSKPLGTAAPNFGSTFGTQQPPTTLGGGTSLFGQNTLSKPAGTAPNSFGFGAQQQTSSFGTALAGGTNLFGNKPNAPTSLFGTNTGTSLFNNNAAATNTNLFGGTNTFGTGTGGLTLGQAPTLNLSTNKPFGSFGATLGTQSNLGAPLGPSAHQNIMNLVSYPYGNQPLFRNLLNEKSEELRMKATNSAAQKAALAQSSPAFTLSAVASPKLSVKPSSATPAKTSLFEGLETTSPASLGSSHFKNLAASITPKNSIKMLKLRPDGNTSNSSLTSTQTPERPQFGLSTPTRASSSNFRDILPGNTPVSSTPKASNGKSDKSLLANESCDDLDVSLSDVRSARKLALEESHGPLNATDASILSDISEVPEEDAQSEETAPHPAGIVLRRGGYYTIPSMDDLAKLYQETQRCEVPNFSIGRINYGNIYFDEPINVAGMNLDEIVHIRHREVVVYPNDDVKPPLGQGLNRKAQITLDRIYPTNKQTRAPIKDVDAIINMDYDTNLRKACYRMKARFVEYIPNTGSWVFKVDHFSKYGLPDDSDDDDVTVTDVSKTRPPPVQVPVPPKPPVIVPAQQPSVPPKPHTLADSHTTFNMSMTFQNIETMEEEFSDILSPNEQLPHLTGMDTSKIRLMKASLFEMETIEDDDEKMVEDEFMFEKPMTPPICHEISVIREVDHETTLAVPEREARPSRPHQRPTIVTSKFMPFPSLMPKNLENYLADSALYQGHCAKTSWAVNGVIVATEDQLVSMTCPYMGSAINKDIIEKHLSIQLNLTCFDAENGPVPKLSPREGQDLLVAHCELVKSLIPGSQKERLTKQVLLLCHTLWGELPSTIDATPAIVSNARRKAVCEWLQNVICEEERANPTQINSQEEKTMQQLSQGKLLECVNDCQEAGDHCLSLIVASSGSSAVTKTFCQQQVVDWVSIGMSSFIHEDRLKVYAMCGAGQPLLTQEEGETLNALQGMSWLPALAAHAWYLCSPASSIPDILSKYETSFMEHPYLAAAPIPPGGTEVYLDVRYQLLKLFSQRTYPMEGLLSVETHYPESPLDFSLSWLLMIVLDSLHYTHVSEHCSQNLHLMFAEQLEAVGLWHWAVFVLLHIGNPAMRASAVEQIILRHVRPNHGSSTKSLSQKEDFIINKLGVPAKMIYSAKAIHAKNSNKYIELAQYHFYAEEWELCYQTIIAHLAADAIISDDFKAIWELLQELQRHSHEIDGWHGHGQVYFSFLFLHDELECLKFRSVDRLEAITQKVISVCSQLRLMACTSPKERLCQSEMAFKLHDMARALILANRNPNRSVSEDYRLRELENAMRFVYRNDDPPKVSK